MAFPIENQQSAIAATTTQIKSNSGLIAAIIGIVLIVGSGVYITSVFYPPKQQYDIHV